tara:strand:+ start:2488 stop:3882 length:1395 start_codon:yes stop_codon:yes gene_type:complete
MEQFKLNEQALFLNLLKNRSVNQGQPPQHYEMPFQWSPSGISYEGRLVFKTVFSQTLSSTSAITDVDDDKINSLISSMVGDFIQYKHGVFSRVVKELEQKRFYQLRSWFMTNFDDDKLPDFMTRYSYGDDEYIDYQIDGKTLVTMSLINRRVSNRDYAALIDERLYDLLAESENMRCVAIDTAFRKTLDAMTGWSFRTVNSISEYHFNYDVNENQIFCKCLNGKSEKTYTVGKGLKRIAYLMEQDESILTDAFIKEFSMKLKNWGKGTLEVVGGSDIAHFYHGEQYDKDSDTGSLSSSCMRGDDYQECIDMLYSDNASMLILRSNANPDKIIGRANLWVCDDGTKFMDRIYCAEENLQQFKDWANDNGYYHKGRQSYSCPWLTVLNGKSTEQHLMQITLDNVDGYDDSDLRAPYMDTFKYLNVHTNVLQNYAPPRGDDGRWYLLEGTCGYGERIDTDYSMQYEV